MDIQEIENNKSQFIKIFNENIKREGSNKFLDWLSSTDFFNAPASAKFHLSEAGGLCKHSLNCYFRFKNNLEYEYGKTYTDKISQESIAIIALLHDICKVNYYKADFKNVKVNGEWVKQPIFIVDDQLPYGHGEKSVYIISGFFKLTREEAMAINWHMGGFDNRVQGGGYGLSDAYYKFPSSLIFHLSDLQATYLDENR